MSTTPSAQYSLTLRVEIDHLPGMLGKVASAIGDAGGTIGAVDLVQVEGAHTIRDITVETADASDWPRLTEAVNAITGARVLDTTDRTFMMHVGGKIEIANKHPLKTREDLSMAYTPGVARVCSAIYRDPDKAFQYTIKRNTVAVVSDGTAVLGLGDIGPRAAMPVMEGKAMLFKEFAGVDAFPICLDTRDPEEIVGIVKAISPGFGGINLEDISAPRCFEIEERLKAELDIPVFHDDQHGTAVVVLAALLNALTLTGQRMRGRPDRDLRARRRRGRGREDPDGRRRAAHHRCRLARRGARRPSRLPGRQHAPGQAGARGDDQPRAARGWHRPTCSRAPTCSSASAASG